MNTLTQQKVLYETDWLATSPYFYNTKTNRHSANINDVIDEADLDIDIYGLKAFLYCGYSVCGHTPVKNVHFLPPHSQLLETEQGTLAVNTLPDPVENFLDYNLTEGEIFELLRHKVQTWENEQPDTIVIPTSGGYDSRLLNYMIADKSRVRSISYGISWQQAKSYETVYPRRLSQLLHTQWHQIKLGHFHKYMPEWYQLYGISTHAHGMYHIEFYRKYLQNNLPTSLLSGIIGDAWAKLELPNVLNPKDVYTLALTHKIHTPHSWLNFTTVELFEEYFERKKNQLTDPRIRVVEAMRFKMLLLSYLIRLPEHLGFTAFGPFLDIELAMAMLNLPPERRKNRIWQQEFMCKTGIDVENQGLSYSSKNHLDLFACTASELEPLNIPKNIASMINANALSDMTSLYTQQSKRTAILNMFLDSFGGYLGKIHDVLTKNKRSRFYTDWCMKYSTHMTLYPLCMLAQKIKK